MTWKKTKNNCPMTKIHQLWDQPQCNISYIRSNSVHLPLVNVPAYGTSLLMDFYVISIVSMLIPHHSVQKTSVFPCKCFKIIYINPEKNKTRNLNPSSMWNNSNKAEKEMPTQKLKWQNIFLVILKSCVWNSS